MNKHLEHKMSVLLVLFAFWSDKVLSKSSTLPPLPMFLIIQRSHYKYGMA